MECYNITNFKHNPLEKRPEGLSMTTKTCHEWCGKFRTECRNALLNRSPIHEGKQLEINNDIETLIQKHIEGLTGFDSKAVQAYIKGRIIQLL